ncbi:MAG: HAD family phosphatase [Candidatus Accumulibacter sp.]|jgi:HAD superfamily hydrolase (TIGR01509 family)|nr:HAD family phosphatase [Accumulibacter sp.]
MNRSSGRASPPPLRAVFFDHDGTLVDSEPIHLTLWNTVLEKHQVRLSERRYKTHYAGMPVRANAEHIAAQFGLAVDPLALMAEKNAITLDYLACNAFPLMPGVREAIGEFSALGLTLAVVTATSADRVQATLRAHVLTPFFSLAVSSDDVAKGKPAPDCYRFALDRLGLRAGECIAIEDTEHGLQAALGAGIECIAVPTEMSRQHDFSQAAKVADNLTDAAAHVRSVFLHRKNGT